MITVIGGTYREIDLDNMSSEIFGSGLRACKYLLENNCSIRFNTKCNSDVSDYLIEYKKVYNNFEFISAFSDELITFKYSFSLDNPIVYPNLGLITKLEGIEMQAEDVVCFGMLDAEYKINAKRVIYDPQTSINPIRYDEFGKCSELIYIVNFNEARAISKKNELAQIKEYFFNLENVKALILKMGPSGAILYTQTKEFSIASYITENVYKIGSGDIFTSSFAYYYLIKNCALEECAILASKSTAQFCNPHAYVDCTKENFDYVEYEKKDLEFLQVYIAAPFFSLAELCLVEKIREAFIGLGIKVFSPFHDVGMGDDKQIVEKDIEGLDGSDIVFSIFDNMDAGTLIESGYAIGKGKKIIGYQRTSNDNDLLMLQAGNVKVFTSLTTAIYQTIWNL